MTNKLTKRDYFARLRVLAENDPELVSFIDHEVELLNKKNSAKSPKVTEAKAENARLADAIYAFMKEGEKYTVTELNKAVPELKEFSGNKVSALVRALKLDGRVTRVEEKGKAYFVKA